MKQLLAIPLLVYSLSADPLFLIECGLPTDSMFTGGVAFTMQAGAMAGKTVRSGQAFTYKIPAPDGTPQAITFTFAEPCGPGAGCSLQVTGPRQRVFSVSVNGQTMLPQLDIFAEAGLQKTKSWTFTVFPSDDMITITLTGINRTAVLSSIAITPLFQLFGQAAGYNVIQARCTRCHGNDIVPGIGPGGLDLRTRASILAGGSRGPAMYPGDPESSLIYRFISRPQFPTMTAEQAVAQTTSDDDTVGMPPFYRLPPEEIEAVRLWIAGGGYRMEPRVYGYAIPQP